MSQKLSAATSSWMQEKGYDPENLNQRGENGDSALMIAARDGKIEVVKELIEAGADVNHKNDDNNNALWPACRSENTEIIELLIAGKTDMDNQNANGSTALMYAASAGKEQVVRLLLKYGANPKLKNFDDFRAIDLASTGEVLGMLKNVTN